MTNQARTRIRTLKKQGWLIWKIAQETGNTEGEVLAALSQDRKDRRAKRLQYDQRPPPSVNLQLDYWRQRLLDEGHNPALVRANFG